MPARRYLLAWPLAFAAVLAACGGGGSQPAVPTTTTIDPATVRTFTSAQVCFLLPGERVKAVTGLDVRSTNPIKGRVSGCAYYATQGGRSRRIDVVVQQPIANLDRKAGRAGYDHAVAVFRRSSPAARAEEVPAVGDGATWFRLRDARLLIAYRGDQVVTVQGDTVLTQERAGGLAGEMFAGIARAKG
jgi:hypothetical protein